MPSLTINPTTRTITDKLKQSLPHALLLVGQEGVGLATIARQIAGRSLADVIVPTDADGEPDLSPKGVIRISQIRSLAEKTRGKSLTRQIFIIDNADQMNTQAQNAFLKLLEEPAAQVSFILTSHAVQQFLPTIRSRVQSVHVDPISRADSERLIHQLGITDARKTQQLLFLASGRPAELTRLATDDKRFGEQVRYITDARQFLEGKPYEKIMIAFRYQKSRSDALAMLSLAQTILRSSLASRPSREIIHTADRLATVYERVLANGNIRLQLLSFVVK